MTFPSPIINMKVLLVLILSVLTRQVHSKNVETYGSVSFLSLSKSISKYGALNFYHYDVFNFEKKNLGSKEFEAGLAQTNFQTSFTYQLLPTLSLTGGHIYQKTYPLLEDSHFENRIFEQVLIVLNHNLLFSTHRLRLEERFIDAGQEVEFKTRLRYQIGTKIPLRGITVDPGEYYLNSYNEFYFSTTGERNALFSEDWFFLGGGLTTKEWGSFEAGPLVQWSRINEDKDTRTHYTIQFGWILKFI